MQGRKEQKQVVIEHKTKHVAVRYLAMKIELK